MTEFGGVHPVLFLIAAVIYVGAIVFGPRAD